MTGYATLQPSVFFLQLSTPAQTADFPHNERKPVRRHQSFDIGYVGSRELRWSGLMIKGWDVVSSFIISWEVAAAVAGSDAGLHEITQRIIKHRTVTVWENIKDLATDPKVSHRGKAMRDEWKKRRDSNDFITLVVPPQLADKTPRKLQPQFAYNDHIIGAANDPRGEVNIIGVENDPQGKVS